MTWGVLFWLHIAVSVKGLWSRFLCTRHWRVLDRYIKSPRTSAGSSTCVVLWGDWGWSCSRRTNDCGTSRKNWSQKWTKHWREPGCCGQRRAGDGWGQMGWIQKNQGGRSLFLKWFYVIQNQPRLSLLSARITTSSLLFHLFTAWIQTELVLWKITYLKKKTLIPSCQQTWTEKCSEIAENGWRNCTLSALLLI